jgi:hypothetical protein
MGRRRRHRGKALGGRGAGEAVKADRPELFSGLKDQVKDALSAGKKVDPKALIRLARAQTLPVPVPMLKGQITRDPMQYAMEQNLRGINGVGRADQGNAHRAEQGAHRQPGRARREGCERCGDGREDRHRRSEGGRQGGIGEVGAAYKAFKASTGKDLDVPLKGLAQDYAATVKEFGDAIPSAIRRSSRPRPHERHGEEGLFHRGCRRAHQVDQSQLRPGEQVQARALDDLRKSVQKAISEGAGSGPKAVKPQRVSPKQRATAAKKRFDLIDSTPGLKAALHGEQPDKFIQNFVLQRQRGRSQKHDGDAREGRSAGASKELQNSVMGFIKGRVTGPQQRGRDFSQAQLKQFVADPNMAARLKVLGPEKMSLLKQLNAVAEDALYAPAASAVNRSNTASAGANLVKSEIKGGTLNNACSRSRSASRSYRMRRQPVRRRQGKRARS